MTTTDTDARYTVISADTHAGGSHAQYREFLEAKYLDDFDAWRGEYKNPFSDLGDQRRLRNWDDEMRNSPAGRGRRRRRGHLPQHRAAVLPELRAVRPAAQARRVRAPPGRHPGPQPLARRLLRAATPSAAPASARSSSTTSTTPSRTCTGSRSTASAAASCCRPSRPTSTGSSRSTTPTTTGCGPCCEDLEVPVNCHGGTGSPAYARVPSSALMMIAEVPFYSRRPLLFLLLSGVFERFPNLKFVMTEQGCAWLPPLLAQLDGILATVRDNGAIGELRFKPEHVLPEVGHRVRPAERVVRRELPGRADVEAARDVARPRPGHVGQRLPPRRGAPTPSPTQALRQVFHDWSEADLRKVLAEQRGRALRLRPRRAGPAGGADRPAGGRGGPAADRAPPEPNEALLRNAKVA